MEVGVAGVARQSRAAVVRLSAEAVLSPFSHTDLTLTWQLSRPGRDHFIFDKTEGVC
jgi:hypothetical protein